MRPDGVNEVHGTGRRAADQRADSNAGIDSPQIPDNLLRLLGLAIARPADDPAMIESGALFRAMLQDNGRDLGFGDDQERLRTLTELEMTV